MTDPRIALNYETPHKRRVPWGQAIVVLFCGLILAGLLMLFARYGLQRELRRREACANNLRLIVQAMQVYAEDNIDTFPLIPNFSGSLYINDPGTTGRHPATTDPDVEIEGSYNGGMGASNGANWSSPSRSLWILVLRNQNQPKQFLCPSDPFVTGPAAVKDAAGCYYGNFQSTSLSYSITYPWANTATTSGAGGWWKNTSASEFAIMSDMAPEHGTGTGPDLRRTDASKASAGTPRIYSSSNHGGKGQNVAYADAHVEWTTDPYVGQMNDSIWTNGGTVFVTTGGIPTVRGRSASNNSGYIPYDVFMVPVRNVATGEM